MANFFRINEIVDNSTLPVIPYTTNKGSLLLMDNNLSMVDISGYKDSVDSATSGLVKLSIPNLANGIVDGVNQPNVTLETLKTVNVIPLSITETTSKGGLRLSSVGNVTSTSANNTTGLTMGDLGGSLNTYLSNNKSHGIFGSIWARIVSPVPSPSNIYALFNVGNTGNINYGYFNITGDSARGSLGTERIGSLVSGGLISFKAAGVYNDESFSVGNKIVLPFYGTGNAPDIIIYRVYLEDLDVSGLTWEQAKQNDDALYQAAFANGGRLSGDTW